MLTNKCCQVGSRVGGWELSLLPILAQAGSLGNFGFLCDAILGRHRSTWRSLLVTSEPQTKQRDTGPWGPRAAMAALFGPWQDLSNFRSLDDVLDFFSVPEDVWRTFELQVGSPGADLRLLAPLPKAALVSGCGNALTPQGPLTPSQATQVGLVWRLSRRFLATQSNVREEEFVDGIGVKARVSSY